MTLIMQIDENVMVKSAKKQSLSADSHDVFINISKT